MTIPSGDIDEPVSWCDRTLTRTIASQRIKIYCSPGVAKPAELAAFVLTIEPSDVSAHAR